MSPTRRTVLRATGLLTAGALAGCTARGNDGSNPTDMPDDTDDSTDGPTETPPDDGSDGADGTRPTGTGGPGISLRGVDDAPAIPVVPSVEIAEPVATDDRPPQLRVTVENPSDERVRVGEGRSVFFQYESDDTGSLVLLPADGQYPAETGCWRLSEGIAVTTEYRVLTLNPGESRSELVDLYAAPDDGGDACLPVGEYRFEATYRVEGVLRGTAAKPEDESSGGDGAAAEGTDGRASDGTGTDDAPAEPSQATWGFSLALE